MADAKAIAGFFRTRGEAEAAQKDLLSNGFTREEVSFVSGDTTGHETPAVGPIEEVGEDKEAGRDAWIGGAVGLAAGVIAVVLPGIGPLIAMGPIAGAIGGMSVGFGAGGIIGLLKDHGVSEKEAEFYAEGVARGGALITVHDVADDRESRARKILDDHGAMKVEDLAREYGTPKTRKAG